MWFGCHSDTQSIWSNIINVQIQIINQFPYLSQCLPIASVIKIWVGELQYLLLRCLQPNPWTTQKNPVRWRGNQQRWLDNTPNPERNTKVKRSKALQKSTLPFPVNNWRKIWMRMVEKLLWYELIEWN